MRTDDSKAKLPQLYRDPFGVMDIAIHTVLVLVTILAAEVHQETALELAQPGVELASTNNRVHLFIANVMHQ